MFSIHSILITNFMGLEKFTAGPAQPLDPCILDGEPSNVLIRRALRFALCGRLTDAGGDEIDPKQMVGPLRGISIVDVVCGENETPRFSVYIEITKKNRARVKITRWEQSLRNGQGDFQIGTPVSNAENPWAWLWTQYGTSLDVVIGPPMTAAVPWIESDGEQERLQTIHDLESVQVPQDIAAIVDRPGITLERLMETLEVLQKKAESPKSAPLVAQAQAAESAAKEADMKCGGCLTCIDQARHDCIQELEAVLKAFEGLGAGRSWINAVQSRALCPVCSGVYDRETALGRLKPKLAQRETEADEAAKKFTDAFEALIKLYEQYQGWLAIYLKTVSDRRVLSAQIDMANASCKVDPELEARIARGEQAIVEWHRREKLARLKGEIS